MPAAGGIGTVSCSNPSFAVGSAVFTLVVKVDGATAVNAVITNTATASSATTDPNPGNNSGTATTSSVSLSDLSVTKVDTPDPVNAGANLTYTITETNAGPSNAGSATLADPLPAGTTFVSIVMPAGWSCTTPAVGAGGLVLCTNPSFAVGSAVFTLVVQVGAGVAPGTVLTNSANAGAGTAYTTSGSLTGTATTTVQSPATVSGTKSVSGTFAPNGFITYTVVLSNSGPSTQADNPGHEFTDVLPAGLTLNSAMATSGTPVATVATRTVTWDGSIPAGGSVTITIHATIDPGVAPGTNLTNQGTIAYDADGNGTNEATASTDDPAVGGAADPTTFQVQAAPAPPAVPTLDEAGLLLLALLLAMGGAVTLRRRRA
jgi:uncharacterized repeat protein (TIGR01451 family)